MPQVTFRALKNLLLAIVRNSRSFQEEKEKGGCVGTQNWLILHTTGERESKLRESYEVTYSLCSCRVIDRKDFLACDFSVCSGKAEHFPQRAGTLRKPGQRALRLRNKA